MTKTAIKIILTLLLAVVFAVGCENESTTVLNPSQELVLSATKARESHLDSVVIDTLKEKGMRDDYIVLVGGAPLNEEFATAIGADAYCRDAAVAVETAKEFMARKHNQV